MRPIVWLHERLPGWVIVITLAATVGALSSVTSVALYRVAIMESQSRRMIPVESTTHVESKGDREASDGF